MLLNRSTGTLSCCTLTLLISSQPVPQRSYLHSCCSYLQCKCTRTLHSASAIVCYVLCEHLAAAHRRLKSGLRLIHQTLLGVMSFCAAGGLVGSGAGQIAPHRVLCCSTLEGKISIARQLEPGLHIDSHPATVSAFSSLLCP